MAARTNRKPRNRIRKTRAEIAFQIICVTFLSILCISCLYPFVNAIAIAFNEGYDSIRGGIYLWPRKFTLENFRVIFTTNSILPAAAVSVFRTVVGTGIHVVLATACAYALAQKKLPGHKYITIFFLIPTLFSGGIVPFYIILKNLHLTNTIWVYILPSIFSFFNIVILRTYFEGIPESLVEAAEIDGCGQLRTLLQVVIPISLPVIATIALYAAVGHWNDWFAGKYYVTDLDLRPLQTVLVDFLKGSESSSTISGLGLSLGSIAADNQRTFTSESVKMAILVITTLPILVTYPFLQRYFIKGALVGSVKG